ncbi:MAG: DUF4437 domain-containing protein [Sneathiella sp.]|nr:DUF4437 domain-containing protein [Sneathiella sp.]
MDNFLNAKILVIFSTALILPGLAKADQSNSIQNIPKKSLNWETTSEGVAFAPLHGDRFKEAYMAMVKLQSGTISLPHVKTSNMFGVVISGTLVHRTMTDRQSEAPPLSKGSFYRIPKDLPHVSSCVSKEPCITFLYQDGKFDFIPVKQ